MNIAQVTLNKLGFVENKHGAFENEKSNSELHDELTDLCVRVQNLCDQETWEFCDGSYITRNVDLYFFGDDIVDFEITHDEQNVSK